MNARLLAVAALLMLGSPGIAWAAVGHVGAAPDLLSVDRLAQGSATPYLRLLVGVSMLSIVPAALIAMTSFTRIVITLSFLRHALGMPETPPNAVLITLALFMTFFTMAPVLERSHHDGVEPFLEGKISAGQAFERAIGPLREFMSAHVRDDDVRSVAEMAHAEAPGSGVSTPLRVLVPAFMLSELRAAFTAGFLIFLPFLLVDLVVAVVLMALGMMMVPPVSISLPLKVMLFVLMDGWSLLMRAIAGSYA